MWFFPLLAMIEDVATSGAATRAQTSLRTRLGLSLSMKQGPTRLRMDVGEGVEVLLRPFGRGSFATVYEDVAVPDRVWITLPFGTKEEDPGKLILLTLLEKLDNPYLPYLREVGRTPDHRVFVAPKVRAPLRKAECTKRAWAEARALQACAKGAFLAIRRRNEIDWAFDRGTRMREAFMACAEADPVIAASPHLLEALQDLHGEAYNHGSNLFFEFPLRNLASTKDGHLVLLDVLFDQDRL